MTQLPLFAPPRRPTAKRAQAWRRGGLTHEEWDEASYWFWRQVALNVAALADVRDAAVARGRERGELP